MHRKLAFVLAVLAIVIGSASEARAAVAPAAVSGVARALRPTAMLGRGGIGATGAEVSQRRMAHRRGLRKEGDQRPLPDRVTRATGSGTTIQPTQPRRHDVPAVPVAAYVVNRLALPATPALAQTAISVDGTSAGRTFGGIGAISGGGGNSRLLTDYPAAQQQQILDYLFKPGYGAGLQILKVEIGGDTNSTDGSESSIEHTQGSIDCNAGYEWWLMEQAKARNPGIKLYGLAWGAPGWIGGGNFWSTDMINYLVAWLGCAASHGLTINYLGGWNERGYNISWYEQLRATLNADGYPGVQIVGADSDWSIASDIAANPAFARAVSIIGVHYPCEGGDGGSAVDLPGQTGRHGTGKPLWASENGSQDLNAGAPALIRSITRGYIDAGLTAYINWPLVAAIYPNLPYATAGLILASQPWSGAYSVARACGPPPRSPSSPSPAGSSSTPGPATSAAASPTAATSR